MCYIEAKLWKTSDCEPPSPPPEVWLRPTERTDATPHVYAGAREPGRVAALLYALGLRNLPAPEVLMVKLEDGWT